VLEASLTTFLKADAGVTAIAAGRVYWLVAAQGKDNYPCLVCQIISRPNVKSLTGPSGLEFPRIQITCWSRSYEATAELREAVRVALDGFKGLMDTTTLCGVLKQNEIDRVAPEPGNEKSRLYGKTMDFIFQAAEST